MHKSIIQDLPSRETNLEYIIDLTFLETVFIQHSKASCNIFRFFFQIKIVVVRFLDFVSFRYSFKIPYYDIYIEKCYTTN